MDSLDGVLRENDMMWRMAGSRPVTASIHKHRTDDYEMLYVIDLGKASRLTRFREYLEDFLSDLYTISYRSYKGKEIMELKDVETREDLYLYFENNLLVASYTHILLEESIDQLAQPQVARDLNFIEVAERVNGRHPRIYLNFRRLPDFMQLYTDEPIFDETPALQAMDYAAMNLVLGTQDATIEGVVNLDDASNSLVNVLIRSGKGKMDLPEVIPSNASMFMSLGFKDISSFYGNLEEALRVEDEAAAQEYAENKEKLQKFLDIDIGNDFLSWVDDEMGVMHWHPEGYNKENEFAAIFKVNDVDKARERLEFVSNRVRKKDAGEVQSCRIQRAHHQFPLHQRIF